MHSRDRWLLLCWSAFLLSVVRLSATPYAAAVTNLAGGDVTFTLNESADNVTVLLNNGGEVTLTPPPPFTAGNYTFNKGSATGYQIIVEKEATNGWRHGVILQLSDDTDSLMKFVHPRGVAVNRNARSPNFGRIYVSMSLPSTNNPAKAEGIYLLGPDLRDTFGAGARTGGLDFAEPDDNALSPFRLSIDPYDQLYICDLSLSTGTLYVTDHEVGGGKSVFGLRIGGPFPITTNRVRGSISAAYIEGTSGASNLVAWVIDEDRQINREDTSQTMRNSIWRWDIMSEDLPASNTVPVRLTGSPLAGFGPQIADLARGPDGKFYASQLRGPAFGLPGATTAGLFVVTADGSSNMWDSLTASRQTLGNPSATDILTDTCAIDVTSDGKFIAVLRTNASRIHVVPLVNGLPNLTNRIHLATLPAIGPAQDIAFDAAWNIYYVSSGQGVLRVLSPGGTSRAVTRSDGSFDIEFEEILPEITITGISASATVFQIDFTYSLAAVPGDFRVESTPTLSPVAWGTDNAATIVATASGYRASIPLSGQRRFYRVRK